MPKRKRKEYVTQASFLINFCCLVKIPYIGIHLIDNTWYFIINIESECNKPIFVQIDRLANLFYFLSSGMNEENWLSILNNNYFHMRATQYKNNDIEVYQHEIFIFCFGYNPQWDVFCVNQHDVVYCEFKRCLLCLPFLYLMWKVDYCSSKCDLIDTPETVSPTILWLIQ